MSNNWKVMKTRAFTPIFLCLCFMAPLTGVLAAEDAPPVTDNTGASTDLLGIYQLAKANDPTFQRERYRYETSPEIYKQARSDLMPYARDIDADLIVMGNSVHKTLIKQLMGDTVLETIKSADRPLFLSQ